MTIQTVLAMVAGATFSLLYVLPLNRTWALVAVLSVSCVGLIRAN